MSPPGTARWGRAGQCDRPADREHAGLRAGFAHGQPGPVGVPGELHLAGVGLASHYLNRPALTAERFCPDPFGEPGQRLYRTGDLVRWRDDGSLEYLGRNDHQIKLRGLRIEPGEIEHTLGPHPDIAAVAVVLTTPAGRPAFLTGYLASGPAATSMATNCATHLADRLPLHMIPAAYLPPGPITPDHQRQTRPARATSKRSHHAADRHPATATERTPGRHLGRHLLDMPHHQHHLNHNFFSDGGQLAGPDAADRRHRDRLGVELELRHLYLAPTLGAVAALVDERAARTGRRSGTAERPARSLVPLRVPAAAAAVPGARHRRLGGAVPAAGGVARS